MVVFRKIRSSGKLRKHNNRYNGDSLKVEHMVYIAQIAAIGAMLHLHHVSLHGFMMAGFFRCDEVGVGDIDKKRQQQHDLDPSLQDTIPFLYDWVHSTFFENGCQLKDAFDTIDLRALGIEICCANRHAA